MEIEANKVVKESHERDLAAMELEIQDLLTKLDGKD